MSSKYAAKDPKAVNRGKKSGQARKQGDAKKEGDAQKQSDNSCSISVHKLE